MSIPLIVTAGFSNGSLVGEITDVVLRGFSIGDPIIPPPVIPDVPDEIVVPPIVPLPLIAFLGSGVLMFSKDNQFFVLNPEEDPSIVAIEEQTEVIKKQTVVIEELKEENQLLNARVEEAYNTKINKEDLIDGQI